MSSNYPAGVTTATLDQEYREMNSNDAYNAEEKLFDSAKFQDQVLTLVCDLLRNHPAFTPETCAEYRKLHEAGRNDIEEAYRTYTP